MIVVGADKRWRDLSFENVPVPGGFRVSAEIRHRQVRRIRISSTVGGTLRLAPGFTGPWSLDGVPQDGLLLTLPTAPGQRYVLQGAVRTECVVT